jgi:hypothetical protein
VQYEGVLRKKAAGSNTWTTVANLGDANSMYVAAAAVDTAGNIFLSAQVGEQDGAHWQTWEIGGGTGSPVVIDDTRGFPSSETLDATGNLYVAGSQNVVTKHTSQTEWTVRKGTLNTITGKWSFATIDQVASNSWVNGIDAVSTTVNGVPSISIYAVGQVAAGSSGIDHTWVVRRSVNGGAWSQVDSFKFTSSGGSYAYAVAADGAGNVYVVGEASLATITGYTRNHAPVYSYTPHWITRKSANGGASWTVSDDYQLVKGIYVQPAAVTSDPQDTIYVAGYADDNAGVQHAVVRKLVNGSWSTVDDFTAGSTSAGAYYTAITADSAGNVYAGGEYFDDSQGVWDWVIRSQPAAPMNVAAALDSSSPSTTIDLSWSNPADLDSSATALYRSSDSGQTFTLVATLPTSTMTYADSGLVAGTSYRYYLVNLLNSDGSSERSLTGDLATLST